MGTNTRLGRAAALLLAAGLSLCAAREAGAGDAERRGPDATLGAALHRAIDRSPGRPVGERRWPLPEPSADVERLPSTLDEARRAPARPAPSDRGSVRHAIRIYEGTSLGCAGPVRDGAMGPPALALAGGALAPLLGVADGPAKPAPTPAERPTPLPKPDAKPASPPAPAPGDTPAPKPAADAKPGAAPPDRPVAKPTPAPGATLDELLGITDAKPAQPGKPGEAATGAPGDAPAGAPAPGPAGDPTDADLNRLLSAQEMGDALQQAISLMDDAAVRLNAHADHGLDTQRVQEGVLKRLDQLLASLDDQQSSSSSSSSSSSQQQSPKNDPGQQQSRAQKKASGSQQGEGQREGERANLPGRQDGALAPAIESARAAWGSLPARVRDSLMQGSADRFSARYKALTEEYYKRLAEEAGK